MKKEFMSISYLVALNIYVYWFTEYNKHQQEIKSLDTNFPDLYVVIGFNIRFANGNLLPMDSEIFLML